MKNALTIGVVMAALAATLPFVGASSKPGTDAKTNTAASNAIAPDYAIVAQNTASVPVYDRGPRIIIVPQAFERDRVNSRASADTNVTDDDDDIAPPRRTAAPPPVRTTPRWGARAEPERVEKPYVAPPPRRAETPPAQHPRVEKRTVRLIDMSRPKAGQGPQPVPQAPIPQPPGPRRAVLSAPPMPAEGPAPRFDSNTDAKADEPAAAPADADESAPPGEVTADSPPPGYTPPGGRLN